MEELVRSKQLLEEEVGRRSKAAVDSLRKELQSEKDNVESLSSKSVEYKERLGKLCVISHDYPFIHHACMHGWLVQHIRLWSSRGMSKT